MPLGRVFTFAFVTSIFSFLRPGIFPHRPSNFHTQRPHTCTIMRTRMNKSRKSIDWFTKTLYSSEHLCRQRNRYANSVGHRTHGGRFRKKSLYFFMIDIVMMCAESFHTDFHTQKNTPATSRRDDGGICLCAVSSSHLNTSCSDWGKRDLPPRYTGMHGWRLSSAP